MKPIHIVFIAVIAIVIGVVFSTNADSSSYVDFEKAITMMQEGDDEKVHVVGSLPKSPSGEILGMEYAPSKDPNYFGFQLIDEKGITKKVVFLNPKPQDFERSDKVVVIGRMKGEVFICDKILMKCPSKYEDNKLEVKEAEVK